MFQEFPYVGQKCWVHTVIGYPLPAGLEDRDPVTVIEVGNQRVVVRSRHRQEWDLPRISVDSGHSVILDGERVGEHHPKFAAYFRRALHELEAKRGRFTGSESDRLEQISKWRWLLERNGFDPDAPIPSCPGPQLGSPSVALPPGSPRTVRPESPETDELVSRSEQFVLSGWRRSRRFPGCEEIGGFLILEGHGGRAEGVQLPFHERCDLRVAQHRRHPVMDRCQHLVRFRRDHGEAFPFPRPLPKSRRSRSIHHSVARNGAGHCARRSPPTRRTTRPG